VGGNNKEVSCKRLQSGMRLGDETVDLRNSSGDQKKKEVRWNGSEQLREKYLSTEEISSEDFVEGKRSRCMEKG